MPRRILAVDDSRTIRTALKITFHHLSLFDLLVVSDVQGLLNAIEQRTFDLILLDDILPGYSCKACCTMIRQHRNTVETPILLLAGKGFELTRSEQLPIHGILRKPFQTDELLQRVSKEFCEPFGRAVDYFSLYKKAPQDPVEIEIDFDDTILPEKKLQSHLSPPLKSREEIFVSPDLYQKNEALIDTTSENHLPFSTGSSAFPLKEKELSSPSSLHVKHQDVSESVSSASLLQTSSAVFPLLASGNPIIEKFSPPQIKPEQSFSGVQGSFIKEDTATFSSFSAAHKLSSEPPHDSSVKRDAPLSSPWLNVHATPHHGASDSLPRESQDDSIDIKDGKDLPYALPTSEDSSVEHISMTLSSDDCSGYVDAYQEGSSPVLSSYPNDSDSSRKFAQNSFSSKSFSHGNQTKEEDSLNVLIGTPIPNTPLKKNSPIDEQSMELILPTFDENQSFREQESLSGQQIKKINSHHLFQKGDTAPSMQKVDIGDLSDLDTTEGGVVLKHVEPESIDVCLSGDVPHSFLSTSFAGEKASSMPFEANLESTFPLNDSAPKSSVDAELKNTDALFGCLNDHVQFVVESCFELQELTFLLQFLNHCKRLLIKKMMVSCPQISDLFIQVISKERLTVFRCKGDVFFLTIWCSGALKAFSCFQKDIPMTILHSFSESFSHQQKNEIERYASYLMNVISPVTSVLSRSFPVFKHAAVKQICSGFVRPVRTFSGDLFVPNKPFHRTDLNEHRHHVWMEKMRNSVSLLELEQLLFDEFRLSLHEIVPRSFPSEMIFDAVFFHFLYESRLVHLAKALHRRNPQFDLNAFS